MARSRRPFWPLKRDTRLSTVLTSLRATSPWPLRLLGLAPPGFVISRAGDLAAQQHRTNWPTADTIIFDPDIPMLVILDFPEDLRAYDEALQSGTSMHRDSADIEEAIRIAESLVDRCPGDADAHHRLGLAWYHFPSSSSGRSWRCRRALEQAITIDPGHAFALQYLAYLAFDQERYADALFLHSKLSAAYFMALDQEWRALKNLETTIVCRIRLSPDSFPLEHFEKFSRWYQDAEKRDNEGTSTGSCVPPLELRECAEWLFETGMSPLDPTLHSLSTFLVHIRYTGGVRSAAFRTHLATPPMI